MSLRFRAPTDERTPSTGTATARTAAASSGSPTVGLPGGAHRLHPLPARPATRPSERGTPLRSSDVASPTVPVARTADPAPTPAPTPVAAPAPPRTAPTSTSPTHDPGTRWHRARARLGRFASAHPIGLAIAASSFTGWAVVFLLWFTTGKFYASGDVTIWVRDGLSSDLGWQWTHQLSGAGGPSYEIARSVEVLCNALARSLGGTEAMGQRILFSLMWAFACGGGATFVAAFARRPWAVWLGGMVTGFNTWFLLYLPNYLPVVTVGILGITTACAVRAARGERRRPVVLALATVPLSYVAMNPPLVIVVAVWLVLLPVVAPMLTGTGRAGFRRTLHLLVVAGIIAVPLGMWWSVPMAIALSRTLGTGAVGAVTDVVSWSWTHRRNSVPNVLTLTSDWSWPLRQYHGGTAVLANPLLAWLTWVLPSGVVVGPLVVERSRRRPVLVIGALLPLMVLLGKGLHSPGRSLNLALYRSIPGLWLLREPMSKLGPIVLLAFVLCWTLTAEAAVAKVRPIVEAWRAARRSDTATPAAKRDATAPAAGATGARVLIGDEDRLLWEAGENDGVWGHEIGRARQGLQLREATHVRAGEAGPRTAPRRRWVAVVGAAVLVAGPSAAAWPMWTGMATGDAQPGRSERVALPHAWREVAGVVNASALRGKALVLPLGDFYQMPTTWGFYGADNLVRQLLDRPVIARFPEGYITDTPTFDSLARAAETAIAGGDAAEAVSLLRTLGVSHVIVRKDFDLKTKQRRLGAVRDYRPIEAGLAGVAALRSSIDNDMAHVFELDDERAEPVQVMAGVLETGKVTDDALVPLLTGTPPDLALAEKGYELAVGPAWSSSVGLDSQQFRSRDPGTYRVDRRVAGVPVYRVSVESASDSPFRTALVLREVARYTLGGAPLPSRPDIEIPSTDGVPVGLDVNGQLLDVRQPALVPLDSATKARTLTLAGSALEPFGKVEDCNRHDRRTAAQSGLRSTTTGSGTAAVLRLEALAHSACRSAVVKGAEAGVTLAVHVATRTVQGRSARVCLFAIGPNRCVELPDPERENGWAVVDTLVRLPKGTVAAKLYVYADGNERRDGTPTGVRTVTEYREISVLRLASSKATTIAASPPQSGRVELSAGSHLLDTVVDVPTPAIGPWSEVGDCNRRDRRSIAEVGLKATVGTVAGDDHAVLLEAGAHAACVTAAIQGLRDLVPFTLSFRYRTVRGSTPPRVCLLDPSTGTCRALRPLGTTRAALTIASNWTEVRYEITPGKETGQRLPQIYLYADAVDGAAATEYRDVRIDPLAGESVTIQTVAPSSATPPTLEWTQRSPARYHVKVSGVKAPFLLALADSWSPDWKVGGLPAGARIRQLRIDGYRNGWLIDTRGDPRDLDLTVEYVPARWGRRALAVSGATAVALLLVGALLVVRRRRRPSA